MQMPLSLEDVVGTSDEAAVRRRRADRVAGHLHDRYLLRVRLWPRLRAIEIFAPPLGVRLPTRIPQVQIDVQRGDLFVLHSDGVYEARNAKEESYGLDRLMAVVSRHSTASAQSLRDAIVSDVERFRGDAPQTDDVTVVVARIE